MAINYDRTVRHTVLGVGSAFYKCVMQKMHTFLLHLNQLGPSLHK